MARIAFVMDKLLRRLGLSGRSFVPMLIGFGCSVPAIMASRTVSSDRDRKMTMLLIPFMSCSAKIPIYSVFTAAFFPGRGALVMFALYFGGMVLAILTALVLKSTLFRGKPVPFVMELPNYRFPSLRSVALLLWEKARDFLQRAFSVIFIATIVIWFLQSFDLHLNPVANSADSLLAGVGRILAVLFSHSDLAIGVFLLHCYPDLSQKSRWFRHLQFWRDAMRGSCILPYQPCCPPHWQPAAFWRLHFCTHLALLRLPRYVKSCTPVWRHLV